MNVEKLRADVDYWDRFYSAKNQTKEQVVHEMVRIIRSVAERTGESPSVVGKRLLAKAKKYLILLDGDNQGGVRN